MIVLDENIIASQRERLRAWRVPFRQIGHEIGRQGMEDTEEISASLPSASPRP
jgi:hypothetical protein